MDPLRVDVWADVACPWCWIGHARLQRAVTAEPEGSVVIVPRAFELRPELPPEGEDAADFVAAKFGGAERARQIFAAVAAEGEAEGLALRFDLQRRIPNTRLAHRLVAVASREGRGLTALGALFEASFARGVDITDPAAAVEAVAARTELDPGALRHAVDAGEGEPEVLADEALAARIGATAVPLFVAGGLAVTGAQEPQVFTQLLAAARERRAAA